MAGCAHLAVDRCRGSRRATPLAPVLDINHISMELLQFLQHSWTVKFHRIFTYTLRIKQPNLATKQSCPSNLLKQNENNIKFVMVVKLGELCNVLRAWTSLFCSEKKIFLEKYWLVYSLVLSWNTAPHCRQEFNCFFFFLEALDSVASRKGILLLSCLGSRVVAMKKMTEWFAQALQLCALLLCPLGYNSSS